MVVLTIAAYFLAENGRINNFPTYLVCVLLIALVLLDRSVVRYVDLSLLTAIAGPLVYLSLSALWADNGGYQAALLHLGYTMLIVAYAYSILLLQMHYPAFLRFLVWLTVLAAVVSATYSIQLHYALPDYQPIPWERLYALGRLHNPVVGALSYGIAIVMATHLMVLGRDANDRILSALCIAVLLAGVILTDTRSVWVGLSAATLYAVVTYMPGSWQSKGLASCLLGAAVAGILMASFGWDQLIKRSTSYRPEIWSEFIAQTLSANWMLGSGITADGSFKLGIFTFNHAHSIYVSTFFYGGLIGLLGLLWLLTMCATRIYRARNSHLRGLAAMTLTYAVAVLAFDGDRFLVKVDYLWLVFWLPVAFVLVVDQQRTVSGSVEASGTESEGIGERPL